MDGLDGHKYRAWVWYVSRMVCCEQERERTMCKFLKVLNRSSERKRIRYCAKFPKNLTWEKERKGREEDKNDFSYKYAETATLHIYIGLKFPSKEFFFTSFMQMTITVRMTILSRWTNLELPIFLYDQFSYKYSCIMHCPLIFSLHWSQFIAHTVIFHPNDTFAINSSKNPNAFANVQSNKTGGKIFGGKSQQQFSCKITK